MIQLLWFLSSTLLELDGIRIPVVEGVEDDSHDDSALVSGYITFENEWKIYIFEEIRHDCRNSMYYVISPGDADVAAGKLMENVSIDDLEPYACGYMGMWETKDAIVSLMAIVQGQPS